MTDTYTVPCKEKGCNKTVTYRKQVVRGFVVTRGGSKTVTVYLTCSDQHTHKYEFAVPS